ncbi:MFS transporter [Rhodococcus sp. KBS0724]|uniref:MFS transporter n=1 Tax=Rhodococcus sp. KBS0724 TaxID=1179674 RepID=UPI00110DD120|nr:MFS transporter [Rhodococcus sp. KBS0724]TSD44809.1 MFS transporter [Rhodococcus sp. KBS0724]
MHTSDTHPHVFRDRSFRLFFAARTVAVAGAAVTGVAMPVLVYDISRSPFLTSLSAAGTVLPYLVFGLVAGAVADRVNRRTVILCAQAVAAIALASIPAAQALGVLTAWHAVGVSICIGTCFVWFDAAAFGTLPALVGRQGIQSANSALWTAATLIDVAFPAIAGVLVASIGPAYALGADALAYVLAGLAMASIGVSFSVTPVAQKKPESGIARDVREGLAFLWHSPLLRALAGIGFMNSLTQGAVTALLVVYASERLGISTSSPAIGALWTAVSVGGVVGAVVLPRLPARWPVGAITIGALTIAPVVLLVVATTENAAVAIASLAAYSGCATVTILNGIGARQRLTPDHLQGRVNTTARMVAWGGSPVGALVVGAVAGRWDVGVAYLVVSACALVSALFAWLGALRTDPYPHR